jgi:hypothetical protein
MRMAIPSAKSSGPPTVRHAPPRCFGGLTASHVDLAPPRRAAAEPASTDAPFDAGRCAHGTWLESNRHGDSVSQEQRAGASPPAERS